MPHLKIEPGQINSKVLLPGDPARVVKITKMLKNVKKVSENRGYLVYNGEFEEEKITVCNSNMGGPSLAIAVHELVMCGAKSIIRVGSCGALQKNMKLGELIIPEQCVREEGTTGLYANGNVPAEADKKIFDALTAECKSLGVKYYAGTARSHDGFYAPNNEEMENFWSKAGILGSDFETAPLFILGRVLKIKTGSILNIVSQYFIKNADSIKSFEKEQKTGEELINAGEKNSIIVALKTLKKN